MHPLFCGFVRGPCAKGYSVCAFASASVFIQRKSPGRMAKDAASRPSAGSRKMASGNVIGKNIRHAPLQRISAKKAAALRQLAATERISALRSISKTGNSHMASIE